MKKGWNVHHGVAKFAANALTIMCICEDAVLAVRELAVDELVAGLGQWLKLDDEPEELDEVTSTTKVLHPIPLAPHRHRPG